MDSQMLNAVKKPTCDEQATKCVYNQVDIMNACAYFCAVLYCMAARYHIVTMLHVLCDRIPVSKLFQHVM